MYAFRCLICIFGVSPVADSVIFVQVDMIDAAVVRSERGYHLVLLLAALLLPEQLLRAFRVAYQEHDHKRGDRKHYASDSTHVVPDHIAERIGMQLIRVPESKVLGVIRAQNVDAAVDQFKQTLISDLHAEAPVIIVCGLKQR